MDMIRLLRPHQWIKNLFIFLPLFFTGQITNSGLFLNAALAFVAFSLTASAIYTLNDYKDIEDDRRHPRKKYRPLASGTVSHGSAIFLMVILAVAGSSLMAMLPLRALAILGIYIVLNVAYTYYIKHIAILDIMTISTGFVLRLFVGSAVDEIPLSKWIVVMTFLLALFLAFAKRRDDVLIFLSSGKKIRKVIDGYNLKFIDGAMLIMSSVIIVAYILYTTSTEVMQRVHSEYIYLTAVFVTMGIMRYLQITFVEENSGSPSKTLLKDRFIQITILAWILSFVWIIYL